MSKRSSRAAHALLAVLLLAPLICSQAGAGESAPRGTSDDPSGAHDRSAAGTSESTFEQQAGAESADSGAFPVTDEAVLQVLRTLAKALHDGDAAAVAQLVDFPRHFDERLLRGRGTRRWADLDETDQLLERQLLGREWAASDGTFLRQAGLVAVVELPDPDAGLGPVPDRRIFQLVLRHQVSGMLRDVLVTLTSDLAVLDVSFGERYFAGANPLGAAGLLPEASFATALRPTVRWPPDTLTLERDDVRGLVDQLLAARFGPDRSLVLERLHRAPRPAVTALIERLDTLDQQAEPDAEAQAVLANALERITDRSAEIDAVPPAGLDESAWRARNRRAVLAWLKWHARWGATFVPTEIHDPIEPTSAERRGDQPRLPLTRWEEKLRESAALAAGEGSGAGTTPDTSSDDGAGSAPPAAPSGGIPAAPPAGPKVTLPPPTAALTARDILFPAAADLKLRFGAREVTGRDVESTLTPSLKEALNAWAEPATRLGLTVLISGNPEQIVVGAASPQVLEQVAVWMDEAWKLLDPLLPFLGQREPRVTVAFVFDEQGARSAAWGGLLDELVARRLVFGSAADELRGAPGGLMLRSAGIFLQTTFDVAGNAAAGDDEFRLRNEVLHKFTQCCATARLGQLPPTLLWGLGELVELHFTQSVYMFNTSGFVATGDHFDWPARTRQYLEKRTKKRSEPLSADALKDAAAGQPVESQMNTWAALAWLASEQPATLRDMLLDLAELHAEADPSSRAFLYRGDAERTREVLVARLDSLAVPELIRWLEQQR